MNLVGKIFVVLIFVMSLVFMTMAITVYATRTNWRDEIVRTAAEVRGNQTIGWKERYKQKTEENAKLTTERTELELRLNAEKMAKIQALSKLEAMFNLLKAEYAETSKQLAAKETALAANTNLLKQQQDQLSNMTAEVQSLRKDIATSQTETDEQIKKATELADRYAKASGQLAVLQERNEQLAMDVDSAKRKLASLGMSIQDPDDASKIAVSGKITEVSPRSRQVELSIGMDDGVRKGQQLDVYRGNKYVGRVRVIETRPDSAVAENLAEYQQFLINRGDNVASRLRNSQ